MQNPGNSSCAWAPPAKTAANTKTPKLVKSHVQIGSLRVIGSSLAVSQCSTAVRHSEIRLSYPPARVYPSVAEIRLSGGYLECFEVVRQFCLDRRVLVHGQDKLPLWAK